MLVCYITNRSHDSEGRELDLLLINKKKRTCQLVGFAVPKNMKESEKIHK